MKLTKLAQIIGLTFTTSLMLIGCGGSGSSSSSSPSHSEDYYEGINYKILDRGDVLVGSGITLTTSSKVTSIEAENGTVEEQSTQTQSDDTKTWIYTLAQNKLDAREIEFPLTEKLTFNYDDGTKKEETLKVDSKDELFKYQWHLYNAGTNPFGFENAPKKGIDLNLVGAWNTIIDQENNTKPTGKGIVVAVWDYLIDFEHSDLKDRKIDVKDNTDSKNIVNQPYTLSYALQDKNKYFITYHGNGVSGIIAASSENGGVKGEAFSSNIYNLQNGGVASDEVVLTTVLDSANTNLLNASLGIDLEASSSKNVFVLYNNLYKNNIPIIHAQGNEFKESGNEQTKDIEANCIDDLDCQFKQTDELARHQSIIHVGALNSLGTKSSYSSTGSNLWVTGMGGEYGQNVDDYTDSMAIVSLMSHFTCNEIIEDGVDYDDDHAGTRTVKTYFRKNIDKTCNYTSKMNGTSAATPSISGIVALMKEIDKDLTVPQVKYILAKSARNDQSEGWNTLAYNSIKVPKNNKNITTDLVVDHAWYSMPDGLRFSNWYGFGVPDAKKAIDLTLTCNNDEGYCSRRKALPKVFISNNDVNCEQKYDKAHKYYNVDCKLSNLVESNELYERLDNPVVASNTIEIENVSVDVVGLDWEEDAREEVLTLCNLPSEEQEEQMSENEMKNVYRHLNFNLQLSLSLDDKESIIKPIASYWVNDIADEKGSIQDKELNIVTNAFYLQQVEPQTEWVFNIKSACKIDLEDLNKYLKLVVHGYSSKN